MGSTTNQQESSASVWVTIIILFGLLSVAVESCKSGGSTATTSSSSTYSSGSDYNYAKQRFRQEGLSDREAAQAADAVIKFHNAQKNK